MQILRRLMALFIMGASYATALGTAAAADELTGDTRLACEAILCLSSRSRPSECSPSLSRYFGINKKKLSDTLSARQDFLSLCPASEDSKEMRDLVRAISQGAGRCDAVSLNSALGVWRGTTEDGYPMVSNKRPGYCNAYSSHEYTAFDDDLPRYVGTPEERGYWVEAKDYDRELAKYEKELAERKQHEEWLHGSGSGGN
ncbi:TrbM/KikA/MpfK family conjugal transfer protein [Achromobacter mucicolens]|uniref:TrbM/KikA/MpfK family conjugal transfer protein n=1 Tax=Achromobacter mucicolens TaxID=1389922 RepID=UPI0022F40593|nr:TrbM/KikA/MpfK family conjugal transfer protein [Achromobacter mucicolens]WBX89184.1 TrbM/KikA/MpfK family conjugal transfer protein [Achromobacter mucicolens]